MAYTAPIAVMPAHLWLGVLPHNIHHAPFFTEHFGRDELGISDVVSFLGSWLLRPKPHLLSRLKALARAVSQKPDGSRLHILGLQARTGHNGTDFPERVVSPHGVGQEFVRCALSFVPNELRGSPQGWVVVGDGSVVKLEMLQRIANLEGPIVAAANERLLRGMGLPEEYFAAGNMLGAKSIEEVFLDADLQAMGFSLAIFASGSRAIILADPPDWSTEAGMEAAVIEMWLLSYARVLVVTEDSTFWVPAVTFLRKGREKARAYVFTRNKRCYPLPTREPVTDGGLRSREMTKSPCYDDSILNPTLTWQPLESRMDS